MRRTPLRDEHAEAGARFVDFFGWEMPVQYAGILAEATCVRTKVGLFDLCHMGRLVLTGPDREALVARVFSGRFETLKVGRAKYGFLLNEDGYPLDDVLVYRDTDCVHIVINATGRGKDTDWVRSHAEGLDVEVADVSDDQAMIALQGPMSEHVLQPQCGADLSQVRYYGFTTAPVLGTDTLLARTGYTGEDGFELFFPKENAVEVWRALLASGKSLGIEPIGLGARDILRLEAGMPLYGNEINLEIDPVEADLTFGVDFKNDAIGVPALRARKEAGSARVAVSIAAKGGRVARTGCPLVTESGEAAGIVTSGGVSPTLGKNIARALVRREDAEAGTLYAEIRGKRHPMEIVPAPFYKRAR